MFFSNKNKNKNKTHKSTLKTGDILLCDNLGHSLIDWVGWFIKYMTYSDYSHVAMIVKDPQFTKEPREGLYVWEAGKEDKTIKDIDDNTCKFGVQIVPLEQFLAKYTGKIYVRQVECEDIDTYEHIFNTEALRKIHDAVYDKPYDLVITDWINMYRQKETHPQKTDRFVCSTLLGYIYSKLGILPENMDWSLLTPSFFSSENQYLPFIQNVKLGVEKEFLGEGSPIPPLP